MNVRELAEKYERYVIEQRRWFHSHPELAWKEEETTEHIVWELEAMQIEVNRFEGHTGCWAMIYGGKAGVEPKTILLRADIDALPTVEKSDVTYKSIYEGRMHACGHDAHAAMLLGAAKILKESEAQLEGNVKLLFQAAEETAIGAKYYVDQGITSDVLAVYGCHVATWLDAPLLDINTGAREPSCDEFEITVRGKAAHGGIPQDGHDAIVAASAIVLNLQTLVSRINDPRNPLVVTVGQMEGGYQYNIIAGKATLHGTVRTFSAEFRKELIGKMREMAEASAKAYGCEAKLDYMWKTGPVFNKDETLNEVVRKAAETLYGKEGIHNLEAVSMSDDFAYFAEEVPGFFAFIGARNAEKNCVFPHHHECFDIDEDVLKRGTALFAQVSMDFLKTVRE
ncbi:amidohydrolase [Hespellia stercorisuis]|uniref:Amidohydrolase n=1 Tax=Hespellia stercorisuis DSM 15480 TaxID=1121950 RepID=A0A1M6WPZ4_9FIRM|nr:amidohydrolase [Hespellia stercorisuis]SHK95807.1 amidohydrolase [Hespellia stercorisuis DSM 15480]